MSKVTIQEMAKALDLSRNTVALALKGSEVVSAQTRERVMAYAIELGYVKVLSREADADPDRPQYRIIVLRRPNEAVFWDVVMGGAMKEAREQNCLIQMAIVLEEDIVQGRAPVGYWDSADALVFMNVFPEHYVRMLLQGGMPGIFLDYNVDFTGNTLLGDMMKSEGTRSVQYITETLLTQGLTRIEYIGGPDVEECRTAYDRLIGYQMAMDAARLPMTTLQELRELNQRDVYAMEVLSDFVDEKLDQMPEAFVCGNDIIAERLITTLREKGFYVPEDVAVTGFDNEERRNVAAFITTVDFNAEWLGKRLIGQVMWRLAHPDAPFEEITVGSRVLLRRSSEKMAVTEGE